MFANLEALYQQQQRFVADASHELRASITSIRCNLDLLAKAPDLPAEEAQAAEQSILLYEKHAQFLHTSSKLGTFRHCCKVEG